MPQPPEKLKRYRVYATHNQHGDLIEEHQEAPDGEWCDAFDVTTIEARADALGKLVEEVIPWLEALHYHGTNTRPRRELIALLAKAKTIL